MSLQADEESSVLRHLFEWWVINVVERGVRKETQEKLGSGRGNVDRGFFLRRFQQSRKTVKFETPGIKGTKGTEIFLAEGGKSKEMGKGH